MYTHLTNYSINKNSSTYLHNDDSEVRQGHKWTLSSLWTYLAEQGIDSKPVLDNIKDLVMTLTDVVLRRICWFNQLKCFREARAISHLTNQSVVMQKSRG